MPSEDTSSQHLQSLIAKYLEAEKSGEATDRDALIEEHPELADSLREFFASHDRSKAADTSTLPPTSGEVDELDPTLPRAAGPGDIPTVAAPSATKASGKVHYFGDYELLQEVARGGMGVVYKAKQTSLNRIVALKMILSGELAGEEQVKRFKSEAEAAAKLEHPGIVPIFEIGEHQGQHYFSMGFVAGQSLAERLRDGPLPPREAAELMVKICEAVHYAHDKGVIHRDLKPGNVLIAAGGTPRVTDFGLAKHVEGDSELTKMGQVLGTPSYMPPEQASGRPDEVCRRSDVYSLGAILYCLLTGRPPFQAATAVDTVLQVLNQEPVAPRALNSQLPKDAETICLKCLNKESQKRYGSANELAADLQRYLDGKPIVARPILKVERVWKWCKRNPRAVATSSFVALMLIAVGIVMSVRQRMNVAQRVHTTVASLNTTRGTILPPLTSLDDFPAKLVRDELSNQFQDSTDRKLPLAYAMAHYGDVKVAFLVSQVKDALPDEAANLVDALAHAKPEALEAIRAAASSLEGTDTRVLRHKARLAMLGFHLRDPSLASEMCQLRANPIQRTVFIDECSFWCGDLVRLSEVATEIDEAPLRSAICLVVGSVPINRVTTEQLEEWQNLLADWHRRLPDTGTHSASRWALNNWELSLPDLPLSLREDNLRGWYVNSVGLTMLQIPSGQFLNDAGNPVKITEEFLLSDREISVGLFRQFMDDTDYPAAEKPDDWRGVDENISPTAEHPVQPVSWYDAVMFCNWLSHREGLAPCYERTGEKDTDAQGMETTYDAWRLDGSANGYRVPTAAESEYACRAGTRTAFSFGDDAQWLDSYGVYRADRAEACGAKFPNSWGLFDVHGNVSEWCNDAVYTKGSRRVHRGGSWNYSARACRSSERLRDAPFYRGNSYGFRVAAVPRSRGMQEKKNGSRQTDQAAAQP